MRRLIGWLASFFAKGKPESVPEKPPARMRGSEMFRDGAYSVTLERIGVIPWWIIWEDDPAGGDPEPVDKRALSLAAVTCAKELAALDAERTKAAQAIWDQAAGK